MTGVSGEPFGPVSKGHVVQEEMDYLSLEDGLGRVSRNVGNYNDRCVAY